MRKIRVISVGKIRDSYLQEGLKIFEKKLSHYCDFSTVIVKESPYKNTNHQIAIDSEGDRIQSILNSAHLTVACDEKGSDQSSLAFSNLISNWANQGHSKIDFLIGGAYGLSDRIKSFSSYKLSLSKMTMTHQMVRLLLTEQIYRAFTIIKGEKYHHS